MFVDITIKTNVINMSFGSSIDTQNKQTSISLKDIESVSESKDSSVIVTLRDRRTWTISCLNEYVDGTFPIHTWNEISVTTNEDLFNKIESIIK